MTIKELSQLFWLFLSTPSARRATSRFSLNPNGRQYFYPRPPRGGRRGFHSCAGLLFGISIHALREEGDPAAVRAAGPPREISIHALREEGDLCQNAYPDIGDPFLSTPSARRATRAYLTNRAG